MIAKNTLPVNTRTKMQSLLNEGDERFFAEHPDEHARTRFFFRGEKIDGAGHASRYVRVTRDADGRLVRRFEQEGGGA